jgi:hypothetical protein
MNKNRQLAKIVRRINAGYVKLGSRWVRVATAAETRALVAELLA